ncbi:MAG: Ig-like domain-containing protein [Treponema sp.]|uniref:Ig-like domain-containing protein n=1 Tax=Treponema sp. TaxID=166 RepID=UPI003FA21DE4
MKKTQMGRTVWTAAVIVCCIALFTTCKNSVGLGETIDIKPPTINISTIYPPLGAVIKNTFKLSIEADDDSGVVSVSGTLIKTGLTEQPESQYTTLTFEKGSGDLQWTATVNDKKEDKSFGLPDGTYKVVLIATDTVGKTVTTESSFTIDNTPPLLVLDRPSTAVADISQVDSDTFGDIFWLIGQVYDKSPVAKLEITASPIAGGTEYTKVIKNVPANIRLKVDSFSEDDNLEFYRALYGSNKSAGKKSFRYSLKITDDAREYNNPSDKTGSGTGNETAIYYLKDDIDKEVMRNRRLQDVYDVLYGTRPESITPEDAEKITTALKNPANRLGGGGRTGVFGLNPSLNPTFEIIGKAPFQYKNGVLIKDGVATPEFSKLYEGATLQVRLSRNLDDVALKEVKSANSASTDPYQFYLAEWDLYKGYSSFNINVASDAGKPGIVRIKREGEVKRENGGYLFTIPVHKTGRLEYNKNYVLLVSGTDTALKPNEVIALQKGEANLYGIKLSSTNEPPEVTVTEINGNTSVTERIFVKQGGSVKFKIRLNKQANVTHKLIGTHSTYAPSAALYSAASTEHEIEIPASKFDQTKDGSYRLTVKAEADGAESFEQTYHIFYDVEGPNVKIAYPIGNPVGDTNKKYIRGAAGEELEIQGTAFDTGKGLKTPNPVTVTLTKDGGSPQSVSLAENGASWKSSKINLSLPPYGDGIYTLTVTAKDAFDQETVSELEFTYDQAAPVINKVHVNGSSVSDGKEVFSNTGAVTVTGNIVETYGLKSFTINDGSTSDNITPPPGSSFTKTWDTPLSDGSHDIEIKATDKADNNASYTVKVVVDTKEPVFENIKFGISNASDTLITTSENPVKITGTIKDSVPGRTVSGIKEVYYAVTASTANAPNDTSTDWKRLNGKFSGNDYELDGFIEKLSLNVEQKIHIRAVDNAGNKKTFEQKVKVVPAAGVQLALEIPEIAFTTDTAPVVNKYEGKLYARGQFKVTIAGTLKTAPSSGEVLDVDIKKAGNTVNQVNFFENWTGQEPKVVRPTNPPTIPTPYTVKADLQEGEYTVKISAKGQERTRTVVVDKSGPSVKQLEPATDSVDQLCPVLRASIFDSAGIKAGTQKVHYRNKKAGAVPFTEKPLTKGSDGSYSFTPTTTDMPEGTYDLYFSAEDNLGNKGESVQKTIFIDKHAPSLTEVKINGQEGNTAYINQSVTSFNVEGKADDINGIEKIQILDGGQSIKETESVNSSTKIWTISFTAADLTEGTHKLTIRAIDKAKKITDVLKTVIVDKTAPQNVEISRDGTGNAINKIITISGAANDNSELKSVKIFNATSGSNIELIGGSVSGSSGQDNGKAEFTGAGAYRWHFQFDTTKYLNTTGTLTLKAIATDTAGNTTEKTLTLNVDQDSDRPQIAVQNLETLTGSPYLREKELRGYINDDDGAVKKLYISKDGNNWGHEIELKNQNWTYKFDPNSDGEKTLYFKVIDAKDGEFITSGSNTLTQPRIYAVSIPESGSSIQPVGTAITFKRDTTAPQIDSVKFKRTGESAYHDFGTNEKFKGEQITIQVKVSDANGIKKVVAQFGSSAAIDLDRSSGDTALFEKLVDLNAQTPGQVKLKITAFDNVDLTTPNEKTIIVDKEAPTVALSYPGTDDVVAGTVRITGTISDDAQATSGVKSSSTKWIIRKMSEAAPTKDNASTITWNSMTVSTVGAWAFDCNLETLLGNTTVAAQYGSQSGLYYKIPIYIFVEDEVGNVDVRKVEIVYNPEATKPIMTVLYPKEGDTLGGSIQIFGSGRVFSGTPTDIKKVYIQFSSDKTGFTAATGFANGTTINGVDWKNGGSGKEVTESGTSWNYSANAETEKLNPTTGNKWDLYFSVRGFNGTVNKYGAWTEPIKITIDKEAPTITNLKAGATEATSEKYTPNKWVGADTYLYADLQDDSGIEKVEITGDLEVATDSTGNEVPSTMDLNQLKNKGWIEEVTVGDKTNYKLKLKLDLTKLTKTAKNNKAFSVTVTITEKKTSNPLQSVRVLNFRFDEDKPIGVFGEKKESGYAANFGATTVNDSKIAAAFGTPFDNKRILADNFVLKPTSVTGSTVTFSVEAPTGAIFTAGGHNYVVYEIPKYAKDASWNVRGFANDDGSGVKEVEAWVEVDSISCPKVKATRTDSKNKITSELGNQVAWNTTLNLSNLKDGKGTLHYVVTDQSNNKYEGSSEIVVRRRPIRISKVTLKTEIGGIDVETNKKAHSAETDPQTTATKTTNADLNQSVTVESSNFAFKSKTASKIKVEFGGEQQGTIKYRLKKGDTTIGDNLRSIPSDKEIVLTEDDLTAIGNSNGSTPTTITLEFWDEAHGFTQGTDSSWAKVNITTLFDALDQTNPAVVILPFHWNSETDNSLYQNSRANGHIERKEDLPARFTDGNADKQLDRDDKVSGKISIRGTAHDDHVINEVLGQITDFTFAGITGTTSGTETKLTEYDFSTKKFKDIGTGTAAYNPNYMLKPKESDYANDTEYTEALTKYNDYIAKRNTFFNTNGWLFTITRSEFNVQAGHTLEWQLDWDSSKIAGGVGTDKTISVTVKDQSTEASHTVLTTRQVDVVPYITALKREKKYNTHRSSSGAYNLLRGDRVTVEGFNLTGEVKATVPGTAEATLSGGTFDLSTDAKSGKIQITVQPSGSATAVEAINNLTNNSKPYNQQAKDNKPETKYWTDDVEVHVWKDDEQFEGSKNPKFPSMAMTSDGTLYAAFSNYSTASVYYSKIEKTGSSSLNEIFAAYDPPEEGSICISSTDKINVLYSANYHGGKSADWVPSFQSAGGLYCYDEQAKLFKHSNPRTRLTGHFYRFELFYHNEQLQQFKNFRITRGNNNRIHIAYYDTLSASVKYSTVVSGAVGYETPTHEIPWINLDGGKDSHDTASYTSGNSAVLADGDGGQFETISRAGSTSEYCAIALDGNNMPVVIYADVDTGTLRLARASSAAPTTASDWKVQKVLTADKDLNIGIAEGYFTAKFDSSGYLHIAFRNTRGQLCYVKSTNANAGANAYTFGTSVIIDDAGSLADLSLDGTTPYISYMSRVNTFDGIRIARYDSNLVTEWNDDGTTKTKGAWNIMTAGMANRASNVRTCIAVAPSTVTEWKAAVGYTPGNVYRVVKYIGE